PGAPLLFAPFTPPMIATAWVLALGGSPRFREVRRKAADISAFIAERVQGVAVLQAFGRERDSVREMKALNDEKFRVSLRAEWLAVGLFQALFFFEVVGIVAVLWIGGGWGLRGLAARGT